MLICICPLALFLLCDFCSCCTSCVLLLYVLLARSRWHEEGLESTALACWQCCTFIRGYSYQTLLSAVGPVPMPGTPSFRLLRKSLAASFLRLSLVFTREGKEFFVPAERFLHWHGQPHGWVELVTMVLILKILLCATAFSWETRVKATECRQPYCLEPAFLAINS